MSEGRGWSKEQLDALLPMLVAHGVTSFEWEGVKLTLDPTLAGKAFKPIAVPDSAYDVNAAKGK